MSSRRQFLIAASILLAAPLVAKAQTDRIYRIGVVLQGGPYFSAIDGLRDGLQELGLEEGKQFVFHVRSAKGDLKAVETSARRLEEEKVDLIYALATSVTLAVKRATHDVPIMYYGGTDPVAFGLVQSLRKPGGRLTGIYGHATNLAGKRLQLLKELIPNLRRVVTYYNPRNPTTRATIAVARDAARQLDVELIERHVASVEALRAGVAELRAGEVDGFLYAGDAMVASQAKPIIEAAMKIRLPTMFADKEHVTMGALASYGVSYYVVGRLSARNVHRILLGANPGELPIEQVDKLYLAINLSTAEAFGLDLTPSMRVRADELIR